MGRAGAESSSGGAEATNRWLERKKKGDCGPGVSQQPHFWLHVTACPAGAPQLHSQCALPSLGMLP